jgi:NhaP-type Na+/H+ or K+/H+ antiporter
VSLLLIGIAVLGVAAISKPLEGSPITPAILFVAFGLLVGPKALDGIDVPSTGEAVRTLAEATLALVLFCDASRIQLGQLRRAVGVPARLLGVGLPLTIAAGALVAAWLFGQLTAAEAAILGIALAPTDAALGQAVVTEPRVPHRIRQALNVESGLNDGICVPLLFAAVAVADVESDIAGGRSAARLLVEEIGYGALGGVVAGVVAALVIRGAGGRGLIATHWRPAIPVAGVLLGYGMAVALHGSGFIAAFVGGAVFRLALGRDPEHLNRFAEEAGGLLNGVTFVVFGALLLGPALADLSWEIVVYAVLSLTLVRIVPVAIAMVRSGARARTLGFLGWFGPRGLASIVFAVIVVGESSLPHETLLVQTIYVTVGLSVLVHGLSAAPLAARYGRWYASREAAPPMEGSAVEAMRPRGPAALGTGR